MIRGEMKRSVLAMLLLDANTVVSADRLSEALWTDRPPAQARASLHNHLMRLRQELGSDDERISTVPPGYVIRVEPGELDAEVFADLRAHAAQAARASRWETAAGQLAAALALWRGDVVVDLPGVSALHPMAHRLREARLQAFEERIDADLQCGRHREVIGELHVLTEQHRLRERFHEQLMTALYRAGRQTEALDVYQRLRRTLVDELGIDPTASVQRLHASILGGDLDAAVTAPKVVTVPVRPDVRRSLLPADTRVFVGRDQELDQMLGAAKQTHVEDAARVAAICAIDGMGGIGKTALAIRAAHRVGALFPDGQLFLDLHGHTDGMTPLSGSDAVGSLLRSLGVPPQQIPADLQERAAFYRARLDGTRTLVVLDNASSTAQVRSLIPAEPGCLVLVTSRRRLEGLDDTIAITLDVLAEREAVQLLREAAGQGRVPADHPALRELAELCGYMPLALRVVAARLRHRRALPVEDVVAALRDETGRLEHLRDEDRNLSAVFDLSYASLAPTEQRMFRLLSLVPGPDFDTYAAANLAGTDRLAAQRLLDSLLDHSLLTQHTAGRYQLHDLMRAYARQHVVEDADAAVDRLLCYYRHTAQAADRYLARQNRPALGAGIDEPGTAPELRDRAEALVWMRAERANLLAAVHAVADPVHTCVLAGALAGILHQDGPWPQAVELHRAAAAIAHEHGDRLAEANALGDLAHVLHVSADYQAAEDTYQRSLAIYRDVGNRLGEANSLAGLGLTRYFSGEYRSTIEYEEPALAIYQELGDRLGDANARWALGCARNITSEFDTAADLFEQAIASYRELGHSQGEAGAAQELSSTRFMLGDYRAAATQAERAAELFRKIGIRKGEANALWSLGRAKFATGDYAAANEMHEQALAIMRELGHAHGEALQLWELGRVRFATGDHATAEELHQQSLTLFGNLGLPHGEANCLHWLGRIRHATGDPVGADDLFRRALRIFRDVGDRQGEAEVLNSTAAMVADTVGALDGLALYREAGRIAVAVGSPLDEAQALEGAARCAARVGDRDTALADLRRAIELYQRIGAADATNALAYLAELESTTDG